MNLGNSRKRFILGLFRREEQREFILNQDLIEITGRLYHDSVSVGGVGGMIGQFIMIFSGILKNGRRILTFDIPK